MSSPAPPPAELQANLRQRRVGDRTSSSSPATSSGEPDAPKREEVVWGKTPSGEVFRVPTTHDVLTLFHPGYPKSHIDLLNLALLGTQLVLFFTLPRNVSRAFFFLYFAFWRAAYDLGLGWVLTKQSKRKWIVREVQRLGWLDPDRKPEVRRWIKSQLAGKMGKDYSFDELPLEYNTWLLFRQLVDIILLNDFLAYCMFAFSCFRIPEGLSLTLHIMRWIGGIALIAFNLWVKTEAHQVVKDYGWYWGDVFFQRGALVFDGVFELAPHPMYSVGYAGYYGLSLIVGSYAVLFVSLAAHAAQFGFLVFFENPHIERTYGQRKPLAVRSPIQPRAPRKASEDSLESSHVRKASTSSTSSLAEAPTPAVTEGDTATESEELITEVETETEMVTPPRQLKKLRTHALSSKSSRDSLGRPASPKTRGAISQHDLFHRYFRKDAVLLHNVDMFRASDFQLILILSYAVALTICPTNSLPLHFVHALTWCLFNEFGLGLLLRAQSQNKFLVRHYLKHYHYPQNDRGQGAIREALQNWKGIYNMSMCMSYVSLGCLAWKTYSVPDWQHWTAGNELLRHTLGALMIGLHIWSSLESYEVLGLFGWFFGDFFIEDYPAHLEYTGIYRYLNNPEVISGATFFGLALVSGSKLVFALAVIRHLSHWWFLSQVEYPHMRKLYGESIRSDAGFVKVIKKVAQKNVRLLESRAGKHAPEIKRVAREVKGTFDKVYEETAEVVEEFLSKSRPKISEVVEDTKVLLQQSRERLVISRVANDLSSYDTNKYRISIVPSADGTLRFHLGEPIRVKWRAPNHHSRKDWIGIYRVGSNQSNLVTKTSSLGMWMPVHDGEYDGDIPIELQKPKRTAGASPDFEEDEVVFTGSVLPWRTGKYEMRYHHDGKYNVMSLDGPFEIYVDKPSQLTFDTVRGTLKRIVPLCLDSDPSLIPQSCKGYSAQAEAEDGRDPDDFRFWTERQAKRISLAIEQAFDVELTPDVIVADANLSALANRILTSKELLSE
ncbi:phosphatidylethanolamine N-methyltransferase [Dichomitus squalens LYAD-421 SS1]|uniref:Phosphatidylethanolamine N-methyltransferase n=1 Tax=Dichomitus squalens (strain LYAD-421) TaxID=732165 RepID=R7SW78_DICSQ|nr:phosphatidylethanolamine N-methyltransferase [Dichomitus squalens LYAD-421 SS1]EJF60163.1 phosphatidylethanolamine N-methyltransferase [Dichomitus squalens LYAD-421 SS1]